MSERECNVLAAECLCKMPAGHESPIHRCPCGGAWTGEYEGDDFEVVEFPDLVIIGPVSP